MASPDITKLSLLGSVFNHLVLPPKIPGAQDSNVEAISDRVLLRMIHATDTAMALTTDMPWRKQYEDLRDSLQACLELNRGHLEQGSLVKHFRKLDLGKTIILYLNEQNAGLLVRLDKGGDEDCVIFESFEASATSCKVLAAGHAMQWDFPGRSAHISIDEFSDESFQQSLATFLEQASMESLHTLEASTRKAGVSVSEIRDTTDPALITQMLMSLLEAMGGYHHTPILRKRIRDDVNFCQGEIPWRRLPFYLVLRVAIQRQLCFALGAERGQVGYKFLMAILLAELLHESAGSLDPHMVLETNQERIRLRQDVACNSWFIAASAVLEAAWNSFKRNTTRQIPYLPLRAPPGSEMLTLPNSGRFLDSILSTQLSQPPALGPETLPSPLDRSIQRSQEFTDKAFELAARPTSANKTPENRCLHLERDIENVFETNSAMVLAVFTLWVELDKAAVAACPLLADHAPVFWAMERLQNIQEHLADRHSDNSFALRYIAESQSLQSLEHRIQACSDDARERKKKNHAKLCEEYDEHTEGIAQNRCLCTWDGLERIVRGCKRCWHWRVRQRLKIRIQEAFLPNENPARGTIVFELGLPSWLSAYRDATWHILSHLAHPYRPKSRQPEFMEAEVNRLSLASTFSQGRMPLTRVLLPFAADFRLYDSRLKIWHLCGIQIPKSLLAILPSKLHPPTVVDGPSSYEIQANQAVAPNDIPLQAFSAYQKLLAGKRRRWPNLLVEMSSSNLNLSDENTMHVICQLASQAGPRLVDEPLRAVHEIFKYPNMVEAIRGNWREHNIMQIVISLASRLFNLSTEAPSRTILAAARKSLLEWISELRRKIHKTTDSAAVQQYATYGLYAALLCRETFVIHIGSKIPLSGEDLSAWIQASLAVQENTMHDISSLSGTLRALLLRDAKMAYHLQTHIKRAMSNNRSVVGAEILHGWSTQHLDAENARSKWDFLPAYDRWIVATTPGQFAERLHFNYVEGHLLVNGKPRSKLPLDIANDNAVKLIFGNRHLLTYPSRQPGMSHRLTRFEEDHEVHFGLRGQCVVIRAIRYNPTLRDRETLEFVPQWRLKAPDSFDLPDELVQNCGHWLNIKSRCLEIRRGSPGTPTFWIKRQKDWLLDIPRRTAIRGASQLVDPQSEIFAKPDKLTVFQPQNFAGRLTVELKHLDLHFEVNQNQRLQCQQLNSEIDPDQDPGTWYGLRSKIVMREINTKSRSIIVPLGELRVRRNGIHVDVCVHGNSDYARFKIDSILGRLSCGPEPRLIYTKALYHAVTSFCIPDPLIGRTGSSEAFTILQSGAAQPWASLAPRREYYPPNMERIQKVEWDPELTPSIQCDGYRPLVEAIKERSNNLGFFTEDPCFELICTSHLCYRGRAQRQVYDPLLDTGGGKELAEAIYHPRDRQSGVEGGQVYQITRVILSRCSQFYMSRTLKSVLESSKIIGGFSALDTHVSITSIASPLIRQIEDPIHENLASKASLLFRLGLLAFHSKADMDTIHALAAFYFVDKIKDLDPPRYQFFANFQSRDPPSAEFLEELMVSSYPQFRPLTNRKGKKLLLDANDRNENEHDQACRKQGVEIANCVTESLSLAVDQHPGLNSLLLIDIGSAWDKIKPEWQRRQANVELNDYIIRVDEILVSLCRGLDATAPVPWATTEPDFMVTQRFFSYHGPILAVVGRGTRANNTTHPHSIPYSPAELTELDGILREFEQSNNDLRKQYAGDLRQSLTAAKTTAQHLQAEITVSIPNYAVVGQALIEAQRRAEDTWNAISVALTAGDNRSPWLQLGAISPIATTIELLILLRSKASLSFGPYMKEAIVSYGCAITEVQRFSRMRRALSRRDHQALHNELRYALHETWEPIEVPDWLLLEIDSDMLIRPEQDAVARAIIDPKLGNGVLQLSMGKGKTSVIIPMAEAILADGQNLSRVVVPKALLMQTAQILQSRLGGLVGREVIHIPFSRRTSTEQESLDLYTKLHHKTRQCHGIMLTCSEYLLSFKLFGWQKFVDSKKHTADQMIRFQKWLDTYCRDVLDECDFTLSVKTQLNYPSGPEMLVDFHPYRWQIVQELLGLVANHLRELQRQHPRGIQVTSRRKAEYFPAVQFLRTDTEDALHSLIIDDICSGRLASLRPVHQLHQKRNTIGEVLCKAKISDKALNRVSHLFANPSMAINAILLVRGLLLHRIIVTCLGKRWNVQYGLHPDRDPIAVPYEAKGKPSEQAEYGHPDVAILFTCLSFYYAGLTQRQVVQGVRHILQSNDPAAQYEWWTSTCTELPASLRHWSVINSDDKGQMEQLWHFLGRNRVVVNHYLNYFVFPVHARQFEVKLQACSWDIPICSEAGTQETRTTGFSGTNDNRLMLPLTISQRDLPELRHTSAEVLSYLLQRRNRNFHIIADAQGKRLTEKGFLRDLKEKGISVLIDVGAYISEMRNEELAQAWLEVDFEAKAAIYFGKDNRAWVHYRSNAKEDVPLLATPFADDLSGCNVFLDEGHTRGVDLVLPTEAYGAVTLALKLTKDHTVQAAMRLRQLRTTQRIAFYGPPEVEQSIRDFRQLAPQKRIDSSHVVSWLLEQTCRSVEDLQGLYVAQGIDFCRRTDTIQHCGDFMTKQSERQKLLQVLKQPERKTLKELYGPSSGESSISSENPLFSSQLCSFMDRLVQTSKDQQGSIQAGALEEVEQERQVEAQVEQVRQVEKRKKYAALEFPGMHPEIVQFAQTGKLEALTKKPGFKHAFAFVGETTIGKRFAVHKTNSKFFVSKEFSNTVKVSQNSEEGNNFLRPVEWLVWSPKTETALVVIPEEAEHLLELLRGQEGKSHIHLIAYAAPVTKAMVSFNSLEFYFFPELPKGQVIPDQIKIELGILAGRLYVDKSEWKMVENYVRGSEKSTAENTDKIAPDPAAFLLEWLGMRRKTVDLLHTPMGYICTGRVMEELGSSEDDDEA
ncbi:hypothetical protein F5Y10DRAFT_294105 [Nemania abortiva]|nr:hypothetical protein F5Y10DRAFT_294105 [Nemania abortiva]